MLTIVAMLAGMAMAKDQCPDGQVTLDEVVQPDLATAFALAGEGSRIEVCAGTYVGSFATAAVVDVVGVEGAEVTILDGNLTGSVLTLPGGSAVEGLTVTRGSSATDGGGLRLTSPGETLILDCVFDGNLAPAGKGGAVSAPDGSTILAWDSVFSGNTASLGGGIAAGSATVQPGIPNAGVTLDLDGSVVSGNTAAGTLVPRVAGTGGGVLAYDATVLDGTISGNIAKNRQVGFITSLAQGGGMTLVRDATVRETVISGNTTEYAGGGLHLTGGTTVVLEDALIEGNTSTDRFGAGGGVQAVSPFGGSLTVYADGTEIVGNSVQNEGGGIALSGPNAPALLTWIGGEVSDNTAGDGGGLFLRTGSIALEDMAFTGNIAEDYGGGVAGRAVSTFFAPRYPVWITGCSFDGNVAESATGGGVDLGQPATLTDLEFKDNLADQGGALSLYGFGKSSPTPMQYTLVDVEMKDNEATTSGGGLNITNNAAVTATDVEVKDNVAPVAGGLLVENGSITSTDGDFKSNAPDDAWVAAVATAYFDLEDFSCDNLGCVQ